MANDWSEVEELWDRVLLPYLRGPLWTDRDAYDAGHMLMVPLHAAAWLGRDDWLAEFQRHFAHLEEAASRDVAPSSRLTRFQYSYVASRAGSLRSGLVADALLGRVARLLEDEWPEMRKRLERRLGQPEVGLTSAINDELIHFLAIAADLESACPGLLRFGGEAARLAGELVRNGGRFMVDGGWVFQPGALREHPDHAYAGNAEIHANMEPRPDGGCWDSSHAARFPLWLLSFITAADANERDVFVEVRDSLRRQFLRHIVEVNDSDDTPPRLRNFVDGSNGVYRWGYKTLGEGSGYGPYELSGALARGWWAFLGGAEVADVHRRLADAFPLDEEWIRLYSGPATNRPQHPMVRDPDSYRNGFRELVTALAVVVAEMVD